MQRYRRCATLQSAAPTAPLAQGSLSIDVTCPKTVRRVVGASYLPAPTIVQTIYSVVRYRTRKVAACARVQVAVGVRFPFSSPSIRPVEAAHFIASSAQGLI